MSDALVIALKAARASQKMTMAELSAKTGVSVKHICNIENLKVKPTLEVVERLAAGLDVEIDLKIKRLNTDRRQQHGTETTRRTRTSA